jgi:hypothetical protein
MSASNTAGPKVKWIDFEFSNRVQLTSDGHKAYLEAVEGAFGGDIDYAMLVKLYGATSEGAEGDRGQMQKLSTRQFHGAVPLWSVKPLIILA